MSERCYKCFKAVQSCLCSYTKEIDPGIKFVLLMHPKEARKQRTGTGYIPKISIKGTEIIVGLDYSKDDHLMALLKDPQYYPVMMYPGEEAWTAKKEGFKEAVGNKTLLVLILDATWFCSRKIIEHNPFLLDLPRVSFYGEYRSIFTFKHEPRPEYISTVESCYYFIKELQSNGMVDPNINPEPMMNAFKKMIVDQLKAENERVLGLRPGIHDYDSKYKKIKEIPDFVIEKYDS